MEGRLIQYRVELDVNGRRHEVYSNAVDPQGAAQAASRAWYVRGVTLELVREGTDLYGPYVAFTARHPQARIPASVRVYTGRA